jgi:hypothetical protein
MPATSILVREGFGAASVGRSFGGLAANIGAGELGAFETGTGAGSGARGTRSGSSGTRSSRLTSLMAAGTGGACPVAATAGDGAAGATAGLGLGSRRIFAAQCGHSIFVCEASIVIEPLHFGQRTTSGMATLHYTSKRGHKSGRTPFRNDSLANDGGRINDRARFDRKPTGSHGSCAGLQKTARECTSSNLEPGTCQLAHGTGCSCRPSAD